MCQRGSYLTEPIVSHHRASQSNSHHINLSNDLTEVSEVRILPRPVTNMSTIIGKSKTLSRYEENIRPKDSIIILPGGFATSTPKK